MQNQAMKFQILPNFMRQSSALVRQNRDLVRQNRDLIRQHFLINPYKIVSFLLLSYKVLYIYIYNIYIYIIYIICIYIPHALERSLKKNKILFPKNTDLMRQNFQKPYKLDNNRNWVSYELLHDDVSPYANPYFASLAPKVRKTLVRQHG